jgi:hypothetical protein
VTDPDPMIEKSIGGVKVALSIILKHSYDCCGAITIILKIINVDCPSKIQGETTRQRDGERIDVRSRENQNPY